MTSFRITVKPGGELWWYPPDQRKPEPGHVLKDPLDFKAAQMLGALLAEGRIDKRDRLETIGALLYRLLFNGDKMRESFQEVKEKARKSKTPLRVVLEFEPDTDQYALLPWEYLYCPGREGGAGFFIAAQEYLVLSRYVAVKEPWADWQGQDSLRVLIVSSRPRDLDIVAEGRAVTFLKDLEKTSGGKVVIETLEQPSRSTFENALLKE